MHELLAMWSTWSATLYSWARIAVGTLLWFWVISGAIFGLRFLAFVFLDKNSGGSSPLAAASTSVPFHMDGFDENSRHDSSQK